VNEKDSQGNPPMFLTCMSGNLEIIEILVDTHLVVRGRMCRRMLVCYGDSIYCNR
jgi:hypothetical protein